jgi:hypothetical protein
MKKLFCKLGYLQRKILFCKLFSDASSNTAFIYCQMEPANNYFTCHGLEGLRKTTNVLW